MTQNRPLTREEIEEKEALHGALTNWFNGQSMEHLDQYHKTSFGHNFDPYKEKNEPCYDEEER